MKGRIRIRTPTNKNDDTTNKALIGGVAAGALSNATGTSTPVITSCPLEDTSFMCKLTRFFNSFKMILNLIVTVITIIVVIWVAWYFWKSYRRTGVKKGGGCGCSGNQNNWGWK